MGYRGKTTEQNQARDLRAQGWTIKEIAEGLSVSQSSVSVWVRDVVVDPAVWRERVKTRVDHGWEKRRQNFDRKQSLRHAEERDAARQRLASLSDEHLFVAGLALYAGEGGKTVGGLTFPNSDPRMIEFFVRWLRRFFDIDESRLRVRLYLHEGLDVDAANAFWSDLTGIPLAQFTRPYRATPDPTIRRTKHPMGCPRISYSCTATHRRVMALVEALLSCNAFSPG